MQEIKIPIKPGSMLSDVVETDLGFAQHESVINLRQLKLGEWETVKGFVDYMDNTIYGYNNMVNAIEVTLDETDERFILMQVGMYLFRVDYDSGYDMADAVELTLPSGVDVIASSKLRFFEFRGVVRITGAVLTADNTVQVPLWYGYINREIYASEEVELSDFETGTDSWSATLGVVSQYDCDADADGAGMASAFRGQYALKFNQSGGANGYFSKAITVNSGVDCSFKASFYRVTGYSGDVKITIGSTDGGTEYANLTDDTDDAWTTLEADFTTTGTTVYIRIKADTAAVAVAYFDVIRLLQDDTIQIDDWYLTKADIDSVIGNLSFSLNDYNNERTDYTLSGYLEESETVFARLFYIIDKSQYTSMEEFESDIIPYEIYISDWVTQALIDRFQLVIPITIFASFPRLTGIGIALGTKDSLAFDDDDADWVMIDSIDLTEYSTRTMMISRCTFDSGASPDYDPTHDPNKYLRTQKQTLVDPGEDGYIEIANMLKEIQYFVPGTYVKLNGPNGTITAKVDANGAKWADDGSDGWVEFYFEDNINEAFETDPDTNAPVSFEFPKFSNDGTNIYYNVYLDYLSSAGSNLVDIRDYPNATKNINLAYSYHVIIEERAYCVSLEDEEEDILRYSPLYQYDVFPNSNIIQTQVGDADRIKAIVARADRLMILKYKSISQSQFIGGSYYEDIGFAKNGLYSVDGFIVIDNVLYWMDEDDIYSFTGNVAPIPLMKALKLRKLYREYLTSDSFLSYDKLNNELWVNLVNLSTPSSTRILVYQIEFGSWYLRDSDAQPIFSFNDYENHMIIGCQDGMVDFDHDESEFDEDIGYSVDSRIIDLKTPFKTKKMGDFVIPVQSNDDLVVTVTDPNKTQSKNTTKTPNGSEIIALKYRMMYLFQQLQINLANDTNADDLVTKIREMELKVQVW